MLFDLAFIFFARIIDVSLGTIRTILIIRGDRYIAAGIGFFEILVYVLALGRVINALEEPLRLFLYCTGFATGVIVGSWVEERMALGYRGLQVITSPENQEVVEALRARGFGVTTWYAEGLEGPKLVMNMLVRRSQAREAEDMIRGIDENAFVILMEPKNFSGGYVKK